MPRNRFLSVLAGCGLLLAAGQALAAGQPADQPATVQSRDFVKSAADAPVGGALRLTDVEVADTGEAATFALERFQVFADDAEITIHGAGGRKTVLPAPKNVYFRGTVEGEPDSRVFLAALADGTTQGIVMRAGDAYLIGGDTGDGAAVKALGAPLTMQRVDPLMLKSARGEGFACGEANLPQSPHPIESLAPGGGEVPAAKELTAGLPLYTARVAIETDFEFYSLFNNTTNATNYIGNLLGYSSTIYTSEINTSLLVSSVSLWTTSSDPWTKTSSTCGLYEFGRYWNVNRTGVSRTIAHFMSGKGTGGGVAWVGVLCSGPSFSFNDTGSCPGIPTDATWFGGYGFTGSLTGQFNINNPTVMWDIMAVSHEIGHNFNSPHTHCYNGIGGNTSPIDQCYTGECANGCNCTGPSLPGPSGSHSGTIMSYCHLLSGSYGNIALNFGTGHPFGVQPGREAARMSSFVVSTAAGNPSCLAFTSGSGTIFSNGFEGGVLPGPWSGKTP